jgi:hypothetical protein
VFFLMEGVYGLHQSNKTSSSLLYPVAAAIIPAPSHIPPPPPQYERVLSPIPT